MYICSIEKKNPTNEIYRKNIDLNTMLKILTGSIICISTLSFTQTKSNVMELDLMDAYSLNINQIYLFGNVNTQLSAFHSN